MNTDMRIFTFAELEEHRPLYRISPTLVIYLGIYIFSILFLFLRSFLHSLPPLINYFGYILNGIQFTRCLLRHWR